MKISQKYYAVADGWEPGIYTSESAYKKAVEYYSHPVCKGFPTRGEAEAYMEKNMSGYKAPKKYCVTVRNGRLGVYDICGDFADNNSEAGYYKSFISKNDAKQCLNMLLSRCTKEQLLEISAYTKDTTFAFVDGSYKRGKGYGYGIVLFTNGEYEEYSRKGTHLEFEKYQNAAGELEAAKYAAQKAILNKSRKLILFYDYPDIKKLAAGKQKTDNNMEQRYKDYMYIMKKLISIEFLRTPAHSRISLNVWADKLAKQALGL